MQFAHVMLSEPCVCSMQATHINFCKGKVKIFLWNLLHPTKKLVKSGEFGKFLGRKWNSQKDRTEKEDF